jgi:hypothetical protein
VSEQGLLLDVDPNARREDDFYETFRWQTGALLRRIRLSSDWRIIEPCAGEHAISAMFRDRGCLVWTNDLIARVASHDWYMDATKLESWSVFERQLEGIDLGVTNVPFEPAFHIVRLGVEFCRVGFITLLRTTWDEPVEDRASGENKDEWLARYPPAAKVQQPRAKYRGTSSSDSATHAWFIWERVPGTLVSQEPAPFGGPHMTVTRRERDELVALYGKGAHPA